LARSSGLLPGNFVGKHRLRNISSARCGFLLLVLFRWSLLAFTILDRYLALVMWRSLLGHRNLHPESAL